MTSPSRARPSKPRPSTPFYVQNAGWVPTGQLVAGDLVSTATGEWLPVERVTDTGSWTTVYNFRVANHHTYFIAPGDMAFDVWVHNTYQAPKRISVGSSGHHVPAVRKSQGRAFEVLRSNKTRPTIHSRGTDPGHDHWRMHNAERSVIGPRQGAFDGTDDELFNAYRRAYESLDDIRVDVRSPDGIFTLGTNVTPREAVDLIDQVLRGG